MQTRRECANSTQTVTQAGNQTQGPWRCTNHCCGLGELAMLNSPSVYPNRRWNVTSRDFHSNFIAVLM